MKKSPFQEVPPGILSKGSKLVTISSLRSGNFCTLRYQNKVTSNRPSKSKVFDVLIVSNNRTSPNSGMYSYMSKKGVRDKYLSCFRIDHLSYETISTLQKGLDKYKGTPKVKSYKYMKTLFGLFIGPNNYRTLSIAQGSIDAIIKYDMKLLSKELS